MSTSKDNTQIQEYRVIIPNENTVQIVECTDNSKDETSLRSRFGKYSKRIKTVIQICCLFFLVISTIVAFILGLFKDSEMANQLYKQSLETLKKAQAGTWTGQTAKQDLL